MTLQPKTYYILVRAIEEGVITGLLRYARKVYERQEEGLVLSTLFRESDHHPSGYSVNHDLAEPVINETLDALLEVFKIDVPQADE